MRTVKTTTGMTLGVGRTVRCSKGGVMSAAKLLLTALNVPPHGDNLPACLAPSVVLLILLAVRMHRAPHPAPSWDGQLTNNRFFLVLHRPLVRFIFLPIPVVCISYKRHTVNLQGKINFQRNGPSTPGRMTDLNSRMRCSCGYYSPLFVEAAVHLPDVLRAEHPPWCKVRYIAFERLVLRVWCGRLGSHGSRSHEGGTDVNPLEGCSRSHEASARRSNA
ncbi:hypothetical protein GALMADRAFT_883723 [Galerina marginata CBS 339.88]|uniref:Uncharacterized protein n=1 Tax=Galerina marginata (strain CBS 339.88) TaxID=685588 RepID=A0A067SK35_GALM3|nr:hypothetical protein GALMADRAFT_883723 [Galerina marginata CBS 339.88]